MPSAGPEACTSCTAQAQYMGGFAVGLEAVSTYPWDRRRLSRQQHELVGSCCCMMTTAFAQQRNPLLNMPTIARCRHHLQNSGVAARQTQVRHRHRFPIFVQSLCDRHVQARLQASAQPRARSMHRSMQVGTCPSASHPIQSLHTAFSGPALVLKLPPIRACHWHCHVHRAVFR